jgi:hypothetical protein
MKIPLNPALASDETFCFPKIFNGVTTIWILPLGLKRRGIQKVKVFPIAVPAMDMTCFSPFKMASTTFICQRHGLIPSFRMVSSRISDNGGMGYVAVLLGGHYGLRLRGHNT